MNLEERLASIAAEEGDGTAWASVGTVNFDIIKCSDEDLIPMTYRLLKRYNLIEKFGVNPEMWAKYMNRIKDMMRPNPYHNFVHICDVTQTASVILSDKECSKFSDLEKFCIITSALIHDLDHPGTNNAYQVNKGTDVAITYNDISVLENHHCALASRLFSEVGLLSGLKEDQQKSFRKDFIAMVLNTDMAQHFSLLADLKACRDEGFDQEKKRIVLMKSVLHMADISNPSKPFTISKEWSDRVFAEFWLQGDLEKEDKLPISMLCDRHNTSQDESQVNFMDFIVAPFLFASTAHFHSLLGSCRTLLANREKWHEMIIQRLDKDLYGEEEKLKEAKERWEGRRKGFREKVDEIERLVAAEESA